MAAWSRRRPVYTQYTTNTSGRNRIKVYPYPSFEETYSTGSRAGQLKDRVVVSYIESPETPNWTYQIVNQKPFFNDNVETQHFELHESDEQELVYRVLAMAGVSLEKPELTQVAASLQGAAVQQEKQ